MARMAWRRSYSPERASESSSVSISARSFSTSAATAAASASSPSDSARRSNSSVSRACVSAPRHTSTCSRASARRRITFCASLGSSQKPGWPDSRSSCWISSSSLGMSKTVEDVLNALLKLFQCGLCLLHGCAYLQLRLYRRGSGDHRGSPLQRQPLREPVRQAGRLRQPVAPREPHHPVGGGGEADAVAGRYV